MRGILGLLKFLFAALSIITLFAMFTSCDNADAAAANANDGVMHVINNAYECEHCTLAYYDTGYDIETGEYSVVLTMKDGVRVNFKSTDEKVVEAEARIFLNCLDSCTDE